MPSNLEDSTEILCWAIWNRMKKKERPRALLKSHFVLKNVME